MSKVYIISSGSYSDYHIDKIFSNKEKAEEFHNLVKRSWYDINEIEEFELSDDEVFTPYYYIEFIYYIPGMEDKYRKTYCRKDRPHLFGGEYYIDIYECKDDDDYMKSRYTNYCNGFITLRRPIGYDKDKANIDFLIEKYLKVCYDLTAQIRYHYFIGGTDYDVNFGEKYTEINSTCFDTEAEITTQN